MSNDHEALRRKLLRHAEGAPPVTGEDVELYLVGGTRADLEAERRRIQARRPAVMVQIEAIRQRNAEREQRHRELAAQQVPDYTEPFGGVTGRRTATWERLAARAHAEQASVIVGEERVGRYSDPDEQKPQPGEQVIARAPRMRPTVYP